VTDRQTDTLHFFTTPYAVTRFPGTCHCTGSLHFPKATLADRTADSDTPIDPLII